mmetsp:Transcript_48149/g.151061  ORF Transcript_48149/g.151061 Transcript_48149/m.151061 type:complete len:118 (-) Transcript_48149:31-384(-)
MKKGARKENEEKEREEGEEMAKLVIVSRKIQHRVQMDTARRLKGSMARWTRTKKRSQPFRRAATVAMRMLQCAMEREEERKVLRMKEVLGRQLQHLRLTTWKGRKMNGKETMGKHAS